MLLCVKYVGCQASFAFIKNLVSSRTVKCREFDILIIKSLFFEMDIFEHSIQHYVFIVIRVFIDRVIDISIFPFVQFFEISWYCAGQQSVFEFSNVITDIFIY